MEENHLRSIIGVWLATIDWPIVRIVDHFTTIYQSSIFLLLTTHYLTTDLKSEPLLPEATVTCGHAKTRPRRTLEAAAAEAAAETAAETLARSWRDLHGLSTVGVPPCASQLAPRKGQFSIQNMGSFSEQPGGKQPGGYRGSTAVWRQPYITRTNLYMYGCIYSEYIYHHSSISVV